MSENGINNANGTEMISVDLHHHIVEDLKVQHRYQFDSMKEQNARIIKWQMLIIILLIVLFAGYVFYNASFDTYTYEQDAQYDTEVTTSVLNNGTGRVIFNGEGASEIEGESKEDKQEQSDETVPDM